MNDNVYNLVTLEDIVKLPDGAFERCLAELPSMLTSLHVTHSLFKVTCDALGTKAEFNMPKAEWTDDGANKVSVQLEVKS